MNRRSHAPVVPRRNVLMRGIALALAGSSLLGASALAAESGTAQAQATTLDGITVTASKRSQSLQKVPFSIAAVSREELDNAGARNFTDLIGATPSLSAFQTGSGRSQLSMRGVNAGASSEDDPQTQETVGLYVDDAPIAVNGFNPEAGLFDLERVEVLRGPQGTLYGAGAMSGALRLVTRKPQMDGVEGSLETGVASIHDGGISHSVKGTINLPVNPAAAIRASAYTDHFGGFIDNRGTGEDDINRSTTRGARVALRLLPSERYTVDLSAWAQTLRDHGRGIDEGGLARSSLSPEGSRQRFNLTNLTITGEYDWGSLVSSTSYMDLDVLNRWALDKTLELFTTDLHSALADTTRLHSLTQELRAVSGNDGPLKWLVGGYYNQRMRGYTNAWPVPGWDAATGLVSADFGAPDDHPFWGIQNVRTQEAALFGEATYSRNQWDFTAGLRAFDWKMNHWQFQSGFFNGGATSNGRQHTRESGINPKFNVGYRINDQHLVYAQAAKGFRYGGVNQVIPMNLCEQELIDNQLSPRAAYDSDHLWSYEVGHKSQFLDRTLTLNSSVYLIKWSDVQVRRGLNCGVNYRENAAGVTTKGLEMELAWRPVAGLAVKAGLGYTHATLDADMSALAAHAGDRAPYVPRVTFNTSAEYAFPVSDGLDGFVWGSWQYVGRRQTDFNPDLSTYREMDAYRTLGLRGGLRWEQVELSAFVQNLTNSDGVVRQVASTPFYPDGAYRLTPRTVGLSLRYTF